MKRGKKMLCLLLALAVLVGGYYLVTALTAKKDVTEETGSYPVTALTTDALASISWVKDDETITLTKNDDTWQYASDASMPVDQTKADKLANDLCGLTGTRELTGITSESDYGFTDDSFAVTAKDTDGTEYVFRMGDETPLDSEYYLAVSGKDAIYTVSSSLSDTFSYTANDLAVWETLPEIGTATQVTVGDAVNQTWDADQAVWLRTGTQERADATAVDTLVSAIGSISFDSLVTWKADDASLATWGLSEGTPITVQSTDKDSGEAIIWSLLLGTTEDSSGNTYARLPDSSMVYLVTADSLTNVTSATNATLRDKTVSAIAWENVSGMTLSDGTTTAEFVRTTETHDLTTPTDAGETTETVETVTMNGAPADATAVQTLFTSLTSDASDVAYDASSDAATILTATLTTSDGTTESLVFRAYDADRYYLDSDQEGKLLISADTIDKLVRSYKSMK